MLKGGLRGWSADFFREMWLINNLFTVRMCLGIYIKVPAKQGRLNKISLAMLIINTFRRQVVRWWLKLFGKRYQVCSNITLFDEVSERDLRE